MRQSTLFASTLREAPADAEVISHQLLLRAGFIRQLAAGIYSYLPLGWRVLRRIEQVVREEMDHAGAQELLMPALQPTELWEQSGRYDAYGPELIRLKDRHDREFALGPTHEEVITTLVKNEINSYRRLPVTLYQIQTKYRDERRPRFGLLRGREFLMKDAYSFDTSWEALDESYKKMYSAYERIFERCGIRFRAVEADPGAIGGEGGTHEFMALADIGEDTIVTCSECSYAVNLEIIQAELEADQRTAVEGDNCSHCGSGILTFMKGIEIGHVFKLGTKYSDALGAHYLSDDGKEQSIIMGCYGIGVSRILSAVVEQCHDECGMIWPSAISPYQVHLIPVSMKDESQARLAEEFYKSLIDQGIDVLIDDRDERPGVKFKDADLIGIPVQIVIGKLAIHGEVEYKERLSSNKQVLHVDEALSRIVSARADRRRSI